MERNDREGGVKKLINRPEDAVRENLEGLASRIAKRSRFASIRPTSAGPTRP